MAQNRGINQDVTQEMNRSLLLKNLRRKGTCSRVQLANVTGLKQATVTNIMKDFLNWGLVEEVGFLNGSKGRRSIGVAVSRDRYRVIGVRLARNHYSVGLFDLAGGLLKEKRVEFKEDEDLNALTILGQISEEIHTLIIEGKEKTILAVGMAVPGPFIAKKNRIALITGADIWKDIDLKEYFDRELALPVFLEHNANAGACAHMWNMKEQYHDDILIYIAAGQGIGAGIIMDGQIYQGALGTAGEIGHMTIERDGKTCSCGNKGCLELYASSLELVKSVYGNKAGTPGCGFKDVEQRIRQGDPECVKHYQKACESLGIGIINLVNVLNPNLVIVGDEMSKPDPKLMEQIIRDTVKERILPDVWEELDLQISKYEGDPILTGAAIVAINQVFDDPGRFIENMIEE